MIIVCDFCGAETVAERVTKKFCSAACAVRARRGSPKSRECKFCGEEFSVISRADANRQYCSKECSKRAYTKQQKDWREENPEKTKQFRINWLDKNEGYDAARKKKERLEILAALGGACVVCGATKTVWLHVDYKPTCVGQKYRHPRSKGYVLSHLNDFQILCANHHYELTLTGQIEGTDITQ